MASNIPSNLDSIKAAGVTLTAQAVDNGPVPLSYDPVIGDKALNDCKADLLALPPANVGVPNCDCMSTAVVAMALCDQLSKERAKSYFDKLSPELLGDATVANLRTAAQALFYLETRSRSKNATSNEIRVDPALITEGAVLRERMLKVLAYHCDKDPFMPAEVADIRSGTGYQDMASDLARLGTHYFTHRARIEVDKVHYVAADEDRSRGISNEILVALQAGADTSILDLRNRAWTRVMRIYAKLRAAAEFIFNESPMDLANFPALRQAVLQMTSRGGRSTGNTDPAAPVAPTDPAAPAPVVPAPSPGAGPGGNPLIG